MKSRDKHQKPELPTEELTRQSGERLVPFLGFHVTQDLYAESCRNLSTFFGILKEWQKKEEQSETQDQQQD